MDGIAKNEKRGLTGWLGGRKSAAPSPGQSRLEAFLDAVPGEYCGFAEDGTVAYSQGFCALLGLPSVRNLQDVQHALSPDDGAALEGLFAGLKAPGQTFTLAARNASGTRVFRLSGRRGQDLSGTSRLDILWLEDDTQTHRQNDTIQAAREAETQERERLQAALDLVPSPLWMRDEEGQLVWCNRAYAQAVEATPATVVADQKELPAKPLRKAPSPVKQAGRLLAEDARVRGRAEQTTAHIVMEGRRRLMQITEQPLPDTYGTLGSAVDLTREEELETEHRRYASAHNELLGQLGTAIGLFDSAQRLEFFNTAFAHLWDLEDSYLNTRPKLSDLMEKLRENRRLPEQADFRRFKQGWLNMFTGVIGPHEEMLYLPDSTALRMLVVPRPQGGLMMTFEDVSSRLALESSYNTLVAVQKETLDNLSEGVAVFGGDGRVKLWNPSFARLWNLHPEDLQGEPHVSRLVERLKSSFGPESWPEAQRNIIAQCLERRMGKGRLERADGSLVACSTVPLPDGGVLVTHVDMTDTARVENALREKNAALEAAERLKLDFLANVSYQLRTPLSTIVGFAEILGNEYFGPMNARQKEYTAGMQEAGERLVSLINDILDLSTIEAGYMSLKKEYVSIGDSLESILVLTKDWAMKEEIDISLDVDKNAGSVLADERRLKQVFLNLIRNAIAHTPPKGRILLKAWSDNSFLYVTVEDTGAGILPEDQTRIFEPFERVQGQSTGRGAGLGLTLVKNIVELHDGTVALKSEPGAGTSVTIRLPVTASEKR